MSEFPTYKVKVRVETEGKQCCSEAGGWCKRRRIHTISSISPAQDAATTAEARANHAVACADAGLPNVWPVSEGELRIQTEESLIARYTGDEFITSVARFDPESPDDLGMATLVAEYWWSTEAEAVTGLAAVARRWGASL